MINNQEAIGFKVSVSAKPSVKNFEIRAPFNCK